MDVRVVWGTATGPTELASYDAALAAAGVHDYNLVAVSSILPADATVDVAGAAPDLGPAGARLTVVEARATAAGPGSVAAALGWTGGAGGADGTDGTAGTDRASETDGMDGDGPGLVYEAAGEFDEADARERVRRGLAAGRELRDWAFETETVRSVTAEAGPGTYATAVVLAVLGEAEPL